MMMPLQVWMLGRRWYIVMYSCKVVRVMLSHFDMALMLDLIMYLIMYAEKCFIENAYCGELCHMGCTMCVAYANIIDVICL